MKKLIVAVLAVLAVLGCGEEKPKLTISRNTVVRELTDTLYRAADARSNDERKRAESALADATRSNNVSDSEKVKSTVSAWRMAMDAKSVSAALYLIFYCAENDSCMSMSSSMVVETFDLAHAENRTNIMGALVKKQKFADKLSIDRKKAYADLRCAEIVKYFGGDDQDKVALVNEFFGLLKDFGSCQADARTMAILSAKESLRYGHVDWACSALADNASADTEAQTTVLADMTLPPTLVKQFTDCVETKKLATRTEAEVARDCAILYDTGSEYDRMFRESNSRKIGELAMIIYSKMFTECPEYSHTAEARTAVAQIEADLKK